METMSDKQVGELWRRRDSLTGNQTAEIVIALIRKLAEERATIAYNMCDGYHGGCTHGFIEGHIRMVLPEFGIDPAEWEHANG